MDAPSFVKVLNLLVPCAGPKTDERQIRSPPPQDLVVRDLNILTHDPQLLIADERFADQRRQVRIAEKLVDAHLGRAFRRDGAVERIRQWRQAAHVAAWEYHTMRRRAARSTRWL